MTNPSIAIGLTTFNAPLRLRQLLDISYSIGAVPGVPVRIFEDPWKPEHQPQYAAVARQFGLPYMRVPPNHRVAKDKATGWSCMQGAIEFAVENSPEDWFLYWTDDVLPTPSAFKSMIEWVRILDPYPVSLIQWPYWNADELPPFARDWAKKDEMWTADPRWLSEGVPRNPHWDGPGYPRPYINVNGAGFCLRRSAWQAVGGFNQNTWCLDEDIALRVWLQTPDAVVAVPGPPFVHHMGASLDHPPHTMHSAECWAAAGWPDKSVCEKNLRKAMQEKCGDENTWWERIQRAASGRAA